MKWTGWLLDNLGLKLFALVLALLLYAHVYTDRTVEETVYFPLQFEHLPDSLAVSSTPPAAVGVRLRGTGKQLLRLRYLKPALKLSLAGVLPGTFQRTLGAADMPLSGTTDVSVVGMIDPAEIRFDVARRSARRVTVEVPLVGAPARGSLVSGPVEIRPAEVRVSGPEAWVARQETLRTEPVSIAGRRETLEVVQPLVPPPGWAHVQPGSVLVRVPIDLAAERTLSLDVELRGIRGELRADVHPAALSVTWRGPAALASAVEPHANRVVVDAARRGRGTWTLPIALEGPDVDRLTPEADSVRVVLR